MAKAVFDELDEGEPKRPLHGRHRRRRDRTVAEGGRDVRCRAGRVGAGACSSASAPTAPSARTRTRSRSSARKPTTSRRATSSTTRRSPARSTISHLRFGPAPIHAPYLVRQASFVACHQYSFLDRYDVLEYARARRRLPAELAAPGRRDLGRAAVRGRRRQIVDEAPAVLRHRRLRGRAGRRPRHPHQHDHADLLLRDLRRAAARARRSSRSSTRSRRPTGKRGDAVVQRNFEAVDATLAHLARGGRAGVARPPHRHRPPPVPPQRPRLRASASPR